MGSLIADWFFYDFIALILHLDKAVNSHYDLQFEVWISGCCGGGMGEFSWVMTTLCFQLNCKFLSTAVCLGGCLPLSYHHRWPPPQVKYISIVVHIECPLSPSFFSFLPTMVLQWTWAKVRICIIGMILYWRKL